MLRSKAPCRDARIAHLVEALFSESDREGPDGTTRDLREGPADGARVDTPAQEGPDPLVATVRFVAHADRVAERVADLPREQGIRGRTRLTEVDVPVRFGGYRSRGADQDMAGGEFSKLSIDRVRGRNERGGNNVHDRVLVQRAPERHGCLVDGAHSRGEHESSRVSPIEKRMHAESVRREEEAMIPRIPDRDREFTAERLHEGDTGAEVALEQGPQPCAAWILGSAGGAFVQIPMERDGQLAVAQPLLQDSRLKSVDVVNPQAERAPQDATFRSSKGTEPTAHRLDVSQAQAPAEVPQPDAANAAHPPAPSPGLAPLTRASFGGR